jgi:DNA helicase HerA-like ATPase
VGRSVGEVDNSDLGQLAKVVAPVGPAAPVGRVIGTEDSTPLEFWVAVAPGQFIQLDDVVALERTPPGRPPVRIYGIVSQVRARHEGAKFDSDVFLIEEGILPAEISEAAQVLTTRFEPEMFIPPLPGQEVRRAHGDERDQALFFDGMTKRLPAGLSREDEPVHINLEFLDGSRGAHVNISGVSGVATKTSYATFLLYSLFTSGVLASEATNTKAIVFNVKGEDLLFLDHDNTALDERQRARYRALGLEPGAFKSVEMWAPPRKGAANAQPDTGTRVEGLTSFFWTLADFCAEEMLPYLFTDAQDDRAQYTMVVHNVTAKLKRDATKLDSGAVRIEGTTCSTFAELMEFIGDRVLDEADDSWRGRMIGTGTTGAFVRRIHGSVRHLEHLVRGDVPNPDRHRIARDAQLTVIDIHSLNDRAKRFVVGVTLRTTFEEKERTGQARPLTFVVLDELNKYAPREGHSPIKEVLLDIAERGRSLGIILIGAQQTASEVERRIIANAAIKVVGRLDPAEAGREEYGFLPPTQRKRATIIKPGTMLVSQPELPIPLVLEFPFPAWATRPSEADLTRGSAPDNDHPDDPFSGLTSQSAAPADDSIIEVDRDGDPMPF